MNQKYHPHQQEFIKQHYATMSNAELAKALGIDSPRKVFKLAQRLGVKWRAENGVPKWRQPKGTNHMPRQAA